MLTAYNLPPNSDRYRRLAHFVEALFTKIQDLQRAPFRPKWKEVALNATMPGWTRFRPAEEWLERDAGAPVIAQSGDGLEQSRSRPLTPGDVSSVISDEKKAVFREFLEWRRKQARGSSNPERQRNHSRVDGSLQCPPGDDSAAMR